MAQRKANSNLMSLGAVIGAVILGIVIAVAVYNPLEAPPPGPVKFDPNTPYDDEWGKLSTPDEQADVTHILVGWTGANPSSQPKEPRTKEEARRLIEKIWGLYRTTPTVENWKLLQTRHNEDNRAGPGSEHNKYTCKRGDGLDPKFSECGKTTKSKHARIVESSFGFHLIRRE